MSYAKYKDLPDGSTNTYNPQAPPRQSHPLSSEAFNPPAQQQNHAINQSRYVPPGEQNVPQQHATVEIQNAAHKEQLIASNKVLVVDVYGTFCSPCKSMASRYEALAQKYNRPGICCLAKEDVEKKISVNVRGVPALQFFKNGNYLNQDIMGPDLAAIEAKILELLQ